MTTQYSATQIARAYDCDYAFVMSNTPGITAPEQVVDSTAERAAELGRAYETELLQAFQTGGALLEGIGVEVKPYNVVDLTERDAEHNGGNINGVELADLLDSEAEVLYQLPLKSGRYRGTLDFLVRTGDGWTIFDAKLAREGSAQAALQLAVYWRMLTDLFETVPASVRPRLCDYAFVLTGNGRSAEVNVAEVSFLLDSRLEHLDSLLALQPKDAIEFWKAFEVAACETCEWCQQAIDATNDIKLIARIRPEQRKVLRDNKILSVRDFVEGDVKSLSKLGVSNLEVLHRQARLQAGQMARDIENSSHTTSEAAEPPVDVEWEVFDTDPIARIPLATPHDIYFDFEGDPLFLRDGGREDWGLEYLWGEFHPGGKTSGSELPGRSIDVWRKGHPQVEHREVNSLSTSFGGSFHAGWSHDETQELERFVEFISRLLKLRDAHPEFHVYHYHAYEISALRRIAERNGIFVQEVEDLISSGVFVDLLPVVRNSVAVSQSSYSIKKLEPAYMGAIARLEALDNAGDSIAMYAQAALKLKENGFSTHHDEGISAELKTEFETLELYNEYDVVSTMLLHQWLVSVARDADPELQLWGPLDSGVPPERQLLDTSDISDLENEEDEETGQSESNPGAQALAEARALLTPIVISPDGDEYDNGEVTADLKLLLGLTNYFIAEDLPELADTLRLMTEDISEWESNADSLILDDVRCEPLEYQDGDYVAASNEDESADNGVTKVPVESLVNDSSKGSEDYDGWCWPRNRKAERRYLSSKVTYAPKDSTILDANQNESDSAGTYFFYYETPVPEHLPDVWGAEFAARVRLNSGGVVESRRHRREEGSPTLVSGDGRIYFYENAKDSNCKLTAEQLPVAVRREEFIDEDPIKEKLATFILDAVIATLASGISGGEMDGEESESSDSLIPGLSVGDLSGPLTHEQIHQLMSTLDDDVRWNLIRKRVKCIPETEHAQHAVNIFNTLKRSEPGTVLAVQGPPGTGKTFVGGHVIAALAAQESWKIGVLSQGHETIANLLASARRVTPSSLNSLGFGRDFESNETEIWGINPGDEYDPNQENPVLCMTQVLQKPKSKKFVSYTKLRKALGLPKFDKNDAQKLANQTFVRPPVDLHPGWLCLFGGSSKSPNPIEVNKAGWPTNIGKLTECQVSESSFVETNQHRGAVYGATAWGIDSLGDEWEFDLLVIDEAAQYSLAFTLAAAGRAKRILLLGDPRQLPQVVQGTHWGGAESSALGWWANNEATLPADRGYFMEQTWRMTRDLTTKVSALSYRNKLVSADAANERSLSVSATCTYPVESGIHGVRLKHEGNSTKSQEEVDEVVKIARELLSGGTVWHTPNTDREVTQRDVLVVAPYNAQVTSLRAALKAVDLAEVRVGTVDKFQGQEAPIVIVSMTCSSATDSPRGADFVMNRNRLNVAVSRAQWAAYVVYSEHLVEVTPTSIAASEQLGGFMRMVSAVEE